MERISGAQKLCKWIDAIRKPATSELTGYAQRLLKLPGRSDYESKCSVALLSMYHMAKSARSTRLTVGKPELKSF